MARSHGPRVHRRVREAAPPRYAAAVSPALTGVLLDSDVVIEILRGHRPTVERLRALERHAVPTYCCAVSWAEIFAGVRAGEEPAAEAAGYRMDLPASTIRVVPVTKDDSAQARKRTG
jgi:predicted nucleic acid-binding protein